VSFGTLTVIVLAGLGGPLLALSERRFVPIVVGEIMAGILVGPEALSIVDPTNATISFLGQVGFAMLMLTVAAAVVSLGVCTIGVERMLDRESHLTPAGTGLQGPA
jgi:Kef-type K+ transport system membrane component KefB